MSKLKKIGVAILLIAVFLSLTNPSIKSFKNYCGTNTYKGLKKENDFLLFSIYFDEYNEKRYTAFLLNFFEVKKKKLNVEHEDYVGELGDTTMMIPDTDSYYPYKSDTAGFSKAFDEAVKKSNIQ